MKVEATYKVKKWEESIVQEINPTQNISKATVEFTFEGEMEGIAYVEYLMIYTYFEPENIHNSTTSYIGLFRYDGKIGEKSGSFVMEDRGTFEKGVAKSHVTIINESGTEDLKNISGKGTYAADEKGCHLELEYDL